MAGREKFGVEGEIEEEAKMSRRPGMKAAAVALLVSAFAANAFGAFYAEFGEMALEIRNGRLEFDGGTPIAVDARWFGEEASAGLRVAVRKAGGGEATYLYPLAGERDIVWNPGEVGETGTGYVLSLQKKAGEGFADAGISREVFVGGIVKATAADIEISIPSGDLRVDEVQKIRCSPRWGGVEGGESQLVIKNMGTGVVETKDFGGAETDFEWTPEGYGEYELTHNIVSGGVVQNTETRRVSYRESEADNTSAGFALDLCGEGAGNVRETDGGVETVRYSSRWSGGAGATVTVSANGTELASGKSGEGSIEWSAPNNGTYVLKHVTYENGAEAGVETATFVVTGRDEAFPAGSVTARGYEGVYDGVGHGAEFLVDGVEGVVRKYAVGGVGEGAPSGEWGVEAPLVTDAGEVRVWCEISAAGYVTQTNSAVVKVGRRAVTLRSPAKSRVYNGTALTFGAGEIAVEGDGFVEGEGVEFSGFASRVDAGSSEAGFAYAAAGETKLGNYDVTVVEGTLTVTKAGNVWTVEPGIAGWKYGQMPNAPTGAPKFGDVVFTYSPSVVGAAGNYTMTATVADTANYGGLTKTVPFAIVKADSITADGNEPGDGVVVPAGGVSKFDVRATYDGEGHTIATNALEAAFVALGAGEVSFEYAAADGEVSGEGANAGTAPTEGWGRIAPCFTNAGEYAVWYRVGSANYEPFVRKALVTIGKKALTLTSGDKTKVYDGTALTFGGEEVTVEGLVEEDSIELTGFASITDAGECEAEFGYAAGEGTRVENYDVTATFGTLRVTKATYDMSGVAWSRDDGFKYDGAEKRVELVGLPDGVTAAYAGNVATDAGAYRATATLTGDANYETPVVGAKEWGIAKRSITLTAGSKEKTYDGTALAVTEGDIAVGGDGYANGEKFEYFDFASITEVGETAATFKWRESGSAKAGNYEVSVIGGGTLKVKASGDEIVVTSDSETWAYDGEEHAKKSWTVANGEKLLAGHEFEIAIAEGSKIGTPKDGPEGDGVATNAFEHVRIVDAATRENKTGNYKLRVVEGVLKMTNANIRAEWVKGAGNVAKTYDGVESKVEVSAELLRPATVRYGETEEEIERAEAYGFTHATNAVVWYVVEAEHYHTLTGKVEVTIGKRSLTIGTPDKTKAYDGTALTFGEGEVTIGGDGFVSGEGFAFADFASVTDAGKVSATCAYEAEEGTRSGDYEVTENWGALTVTKAGNAWTVEPNIVGWKYGQTPNAPVGAAKFGEVRFEYSPMPVGAAGDYVMTATVADTANYGGLTKRVSFAIAKASSVTGDGDEPGDGVVPEGGVSKFDVRATYDGEGHTIATNALEAAFVGLGVGEVSFEYAAGAVDGEVSGEGANAGTAPSEGWAGVAPCFTNAGEYAVWYRVGSANYEPFVRKALVSIGKKALTLRSGDKTKVYDGTALTFGWDEVTVDGLVEGDSIELTGFASITDAGECDAAFEYAAGEGTRLENYDVTATFGTLMVTKAAYDMSGVRWSSDAGFKYDGAEKRVELVGLPSGVTAAYEENAATDAGSYRATAALTGNANYETPSVADFEWSIAKRSVTLTSGSASKAYDGTALRNESVTVGGDGFAAGEGATWNVTGTITDAGSVANSFGYELNAGTKAGNYEIATVEGTLTVTKAVNAWTVEPGIVGWKFGQSANAPVGAARFGEVTFAYEPGVVGAAGDYVMTATVAGTANWEGLSKRVNFTIAKARYDMSGVRWSSDDGFKYDGAEKRVELVGLPSGVTATYAGNVATDAGAYRATAALTGDANYETPVVTAKEWSIAKRSVTLSAGSKEKAYDGAALAVTDGDVVVGGDGYANGERFEYFDFASITEVGETAATFGYRESVTAKAGNYDVTVIAGGTLKVKASGDEIVVTSDSETWTYDGEEHAKKSWTIVNGEKLLAGHEFEIAIAEGSMIATPKDGPEGDGVVTNAFEHVRIVDAATRENKTGNYKLRVVEGVLKMTNACIRAEWVKGADGIAKTYDGAESKVEVSAELLQLATVRYGETEEEIERSEAYGFTHSTNAVVWYTVEAEFYHTLTGKVEVSIGKRSVTIGTPEKAKAYDGTALTFGAGEVEIGGDGFVAGEGFSFAGFASVTDAGKVSATCSYAAAEGTRIGDYEVTENWGSLTVTKAVNAWTVEPNIVGWKYGQTPNAPTGAPKFGGVVFTYSPSVVGAAGNYMMTATVADTANYGGLTKTVPFAIVKADSITADGNEPGDGVVAEGGVSKFDVRATYDREGHTIATNALEAAFAGLGVGEVSFEYAAADGEVAPNDGWAGVAPCFTNAGEYAVWYRVGSANYEPFVRKALVTIGKKALTLTSGDKTKTYDGTVLTFGADEVTVDGLVEGESVEFSGFASITDAGECEASFGYAAGEGTRLENYDVTAMFGMLKVTKATYDMSGVAWSEDDGFKYDGSEKRVVLVGLPGGVSATYAGNAATDAGAYTASAILTGSANYKTPSVADCEWSIAKRSVTLTSGSASRAYDGTALRNESVMVGGDGFIAGEGATWNVTGTITDAGSVANAFGYGLNAGTKAVNYAIATVEGTLTVTKAGNAWTVEPGILGWKFGEAANAPVGAARFGTVQFAYEPGVVGAAGDYVMVASVAGTANWEGLRKEVPFTIAKAKYDLSGVAWSGDDGFKYDGAEKRVVLVGLPDGVSAAYAGNVATDAGAYRATAALTGDANYETPSVGAKEWGIAKRSITLAAGSKEKTYDGTALAVTEGDIAVGGDGYADGERFEYFDFASITEVGETAATFKWRESGSAKAGNYEVSVIAGGTLKVKAAGDEIVVTSDSETWAYDGEEHAKKSWTVENAGKLLAGHEFEIAIAEGSKIATPKDGPEGDGVVTNAFEHVRIVDAATGENKTGNYKLRVVEGVLKMTNANIRAEWVKGAGNVAKTYDGAESKVEVSAELLQPATVRYGETEEKIEGSEAYGFTHATNAVVWYVVEAEHYHTLTGKVEVSIGKRPVTIGTPEKTKAYDGTALTFGANEVTIGGDGFVEGEGFAFAEFASVTDAGKVSATCAYEAEEGTRIGDYEVTEDWGTLTVTKAASVTADGDEPGDGDVPAGGVSKFDAEAEYDGEGHTIATNALAEAFGALGIGEVTIGYATAEGKASGDFRAMAPVFTNAGEHAVWYRASNPNCEDFVREARVKIAPRDMAKASVGAIADQAWTGSAVEPGVSVTDVRTIGGVERDIIAPEDWEVAFADNVKAGTAKAVVKGKRNYTGTKEATFEIIAPPPAMVEVTLDAMGGTIGGAAKKKVGMSGGAYAGLERPVREGYVFGGWFVGVGTDASEAREGGALATDAAHTLYARWASDPAACGEEIFAWREIDAKTVAITGFKDPEQKIEKVAIPDTIGGRRVVAIDALAFANSKSGMKELHLPVFCTSVGDKAFTGVGTLERVVFAPVRDWSDLGAEAAMLRIGKYAFSGATGLKELYLGEKVGAIGDYAFLNARNLNKVTILGKPEFGVQAFRSAGMDAGGVTVRLDPALASDAAYMERMSASMHNVKIRTDAVVRSVRAAGISQTGSAVRMPVAVEKASSWGEVEADRYRVEYRKTLDGERVMLKPKVVETAEGVELEVEKPEGSSGFFRAVVEE